MRLLFRNRSRRHAEHSPLLRCGEKFGLRPPARAEMAAAHAFGADLIGGEVVSLSTLRKVDRIAPGSILVREDAGEIVGLLAMLPLCEPGRTAILAGRFDAVDVEPGLVAPGAEWPAAVYAWACAARAAPVARALLGATDWLAKVVFPELPFFARAATPDGRRVLLGSLGYRPLDPADADLLWRPPELRAPA